jgi:hypothetical protein
VAGCATERRASDDQQLTSWLVPGQTTSEEVLLRLGQPSLALEDGRLLTFRVRRGYDKEGKHALENAGPAEGWYGGRWQGIDYSLVIAFDQEGRYEEHSLVPTK